MNLNISGHHIEMTDALHSYVASKMGRIERHFDHALDAEVVLEAKKLRHTSSVTMKVRGGTLRAESTEEDMYAAIDSMMDKLDRQVLKHKEKNASHNQESVRHIDASLG